ncbi:hypothetical protein STANM337S_07116 [Streptomyces tanashiensis]
MSATANTTYTRNARKGFAAVRVSKSAADHIIDHLGPSLALQQRSGSVLRPHQDKPLGRARSRSLGPISRL